MAFRSPIQNDASSRITRHRWTNGPERLHSEAAGHLPGTRQRIFMERLPHGPTKKTIGKHREKPLKNEFNRIFANQNMDFSNTTSYTKSFGAYHAFA